MNLQELKLKSEIEFESNCSKILKERSEKKRQCKVVHNESSELKYGWDDPQHLAAQNGWI
jgi:hypothetical protein